VPKDTRLKKLKKLKTEYKNELKGYRYRQYEILANTMAIVVELRSDDSAVRAFLRLSGKKSPPAKCKNVEDRLTAAVVAYVTAAKSGNALKLAWKRARVLDYLYDVHAISPEMIADEIRSRGGIEAIAKDAMKEKPRRPKAEKGKEKAKSATAKRSLVKSASAEKLSFNDEADDWDAPIPDSGRDRLGGEDTEIKVRISPELRAKLMAIKADRRVKLISVRIDTDDCLDVVLEATAVRRLATVYSAGSLAIRYGIFTWSRNDLLRAVLSCQLDGLTAARGKADQVTHLRQRLTDYLVQNRRHFVSLNGEKLATSDHKFGSVPGYLHTHNGIEWIYLTSDQLKAIIGTDKAAGRLKRRLVEQGSMASTGKRALVQRPIFRAKSNKGYRWVHAFRAALLETLIDAPRRVALNKNK